MDADNISMGYSSLDRGDLNKAYDLFSGLCRKTKDEDIRKASLIGLSLVHRALGYLDESIDMILKLTEKYPDDGIIHYNMGNMYLETGQNALAVQSYDRAIETYGPKVDFHINRGIAWFRGGKYKMALKDFKNALDLDPLNEYALINSGMVHFETGRYESAIDHFDIVLEHDDANLKALLGKGLSLYNMDMYDESMICLDAALSIDQDFYIAHFYKGKILRKLDLLHESSESIKRSISIKKDHFPSHYELGLIRLEMGEVDGAIDSFNSAVNDNGGLTRDALTMIGKIYLDEKDLPKKALSYFKRVLKRYPDYAEVWLYSGIAFKRIPNGLDKARCSLEKARSLGYDDLHSGLELSEVYLYLNDYKKAKEILDFLTDRYQDPHSYMLKAKAEYSLELYRDCIDSAENSLRLDQNNMGSYLIMGRCYGKIGRSEEYKQCLRKYLHSHPDDELVIEELSSMS